MEVKNKNASKSLVEQSGAHLVATGIFLSRIAGFIRQRVFAHYFGSSDAGDAFYAALKIPNFLQNLFGEGVLSASFIPVYSQLLGQNKEEEADEVARITGSLLALLTSVLVLFGIYFTPALIDLIAPGFEGEKKQLTVRLVQIFFPGTGLLVLSAWCLGILNSHRKFFLSYAAPVLWNAAIIACLVYFGGKTSQSGLAIKAAWGLVLGSALQFGVQLPTAARFLKKRRPSFNYQQTSVKSILKNFVPVVIARGVVQVSAYVDNVLASFLPSGAVSALAYAQLIYMLPISLFGMAVSAAELPAMSRASGTVDEISEFLKKRLNSGFAQIAFFTVPTVVGFLLLGDVIVAALYQSGQFSKENALTVWSVLAGSSIGLIATTWGRLYSSALYSLKDTRTPLRFALVRVFLTISLGYLAGLRFPVWFHYDAVYGTAGLSASAGVAGWIEFLLLKRSVGLRIGKTTVQSSFLLKLWGAAGVAGIVSLGIKFAVPAEHPLIRAGIVLAPYALIYGLITSALQVEHSLRILKRLRKRAGG